MATATDKTLPSFSIILETENLCEADLDGLGESLGSLAAQSVPPQDAREVLVIDSGDAPPEILAALTARHPWITVRRAPASTGYYGAKMLGAGMATGEVVVYCDSDCLYERDWLENLLGPFRDPTVAAVAGETTTGGRGPYATAMALTYIFPQHSGETELAEAAGYFLNNVAFRRSVLLEHPIPLDLPLYRGHCVVHARRLREAGLVIWRQPAARATHAPPASLSHFVWRFLLIGHDHRWQQRLVGPPTGTGTADPDPMRGLGGKLRVFADRAGRMFRQPRHWLSLPLAAPIAAASVLLVLAGHLTALVRPHAVLEIYNRLHGE